MEANLDQFWITSLAALAAGITALVLLVRRDLAPAGPLRQALTGEKRWFLAGALGIGILAFSLKLLVVFLLTSYPERTIAPLLDMAAERAKARAATSSPRPGGTADAGPGQTWKTWSALPAQAPAPAANPTTPAKVALGRKLFNDPNLSADGTVACASCHDLSTHGGADGRAVAEGVGGQRGARNTPTVFNAAFQARLFWDGRAASLEDQAAGPLLNPIEMAMPSPQAVVARVVEDPSYGPAFGAAFGPDAAVTMNAIARAIAAYERTLITADSPYDRFIRGDADALTRPQKKGMYLFQKLGCKVCHAGPNFSGASLVGPPRPFAHLRVDRLNAAMNHGLGTDKGKGGDAAKFGLWRIPSLRNVALTAPYFHNGSVDTLTEAVRVMARAQLGAILGAPADGTAVETLEWAPARDKLYMSKRKQVSDQDIADIVAFLNALTSARLRSPVREARR